MLYDIKKSMENAKKTMDEASINPNNNLENGQDPLNMMSTPARPNEDDLINKNDLELH